MGEGSESDRRGRGQGVGTGTSSGSGGNGSGFGGRGSGHRAAMLARYGGTKQSERAVAGALHWLMRHQCYEGNWSFDKYNAQCKDASCTGAGGATADAGATGHGPAVLPRPPVRPIRPTAPTA